MNQFEIPRAFPSETGFGMTLRDYFAAKAMQAFMDPRFGPAIGHESNADGVSRSVFLAEAAYEMADGMMVARDKPATT